MSPRGLPYALNYASTVQHGDTFLLVGGYDDDNDEYSRNILQYVPEDEDWVQFGHALLFARAETAAISVPGYVGNCE